MATITFSVRWTSNSGREARRRGPGVSSGRVEPATGRGEASNSRRNSGRVPRQADTVPETLASLETRVTPGGRRVFGALGDRLPEDYSRASSRSRQTKYPSDLPAKTSYL